MSAIESLTSLDRTLANIREEHLKEMKALTDQLLASRIEAQILRDSCAQERKDRLACERVTMKLITQFGVVEKVFAEAKALAMELHENEVKADTDDKTLDPGHITMLDQNSFGGEAQ